MPPSPVQIVNYVATALSQLTSQFSRPRPDAIIVSTGTGIQHITAGVSDGAAFIGTAGQVLITNLGGTDTSWVTTLPASAIPQPTGTGFAHLTTGAQDAAAALVDVTQASHVIAVSPPPDVELRPLLLPSSFKRSLTAATSVFVDQWNDISRSMPTEFLQSTVANMPFTHLSIASSTNASPIAVTTSVNHNLATGDIVNVTTHATNTTANGKRTITVTGANTFTLNGTTGVGVGGATGFVELLLNDYPVLHCTTQTASPTSMTGPTMLSVLPTSGDDYVMWVVFRAHSVTGTSVDASIFNNDGLLAENSSFLGTYLQNLTGTIFCAHYFFSGGVNVAKSQVSLDTWVVAQFRKSNGQIFTKVNTSSETAGVSVGNLGTISSAAVFRIGIGGTTGNQVMNGQIAAIGVCRNVDVAADTAAGGRCQRTRQFLGSKFGITVN